MTALVSLSGGIDSATALAWSISQGCGCCAASFFYGSKHNVYEGQSAKEIAHHYKVGLHSLSMAGLMQDFKSDLLLSGEGIPEGHYESENMKKTVVPCRNLMFIATLAGLADSLGAECVVLGVHSGDHAIYPDCRPEFIEAAARAVQLATERRVHLVTPFLYQNKADIVATGLTLGVPYQMTRTCYKDQPIACGVCGSCTERLEAFELNGVKDPISYE